MGGGEGVTNRTLLLSWCFTTTETFRLFGRGSRLWLSTAHSARSTVTLITWRWGGGYTRGLLPRPNLEPDFFIFQTQTISAQHKQPMTARVSNPATGRRPFLAFQSAGGDRSKRHHLRHPPLERCVIPLTSGRRSSLVARAPSGAIIA